MMTRVNGCVVFACIACVVEQHLTAMDTALAILQRSLELLNTELSIIKDLTRPELVPLAINFDGLNP